MHLVHTDLLDGDVCPVVDGHLAVAIVGGGESHPVWLVLLEVGVFLTATLKKGGELWRMEEMG